MEKNSSFERVVGNISEAEKERFFRDKGERFDDQVFEELKDKEREKTSEELQIISLANEITNEIRQKYGLEKFDIPPENIHVITEEAWPRERSVAFFSSRLQSIAIREKLSNIAFMKTVFHEMSHFKSYSAAQMTNDENPEFDEYRLGLTVRTRDGQRMYFSNLNEAVTEEMTKRFARKFFKNRLFLDEIRQTRDVIDRYPQTTASSGGLLFNEDTFYAKVQRDRSKSWRKSVGRLFGTSLGPNVKILTENFTYKQERKILNTLVDKIFERNLDKFQNREEVFEVFAKGMMVGNILPMGRLVEKTFGNGVLRRIGELDEDIQKQEEFVNSL